MTKLYVYVWEDIDDGLTDNHHSGGGALVIAESQENALAALNHRADGYVTAVPQCLGEIVGAERGLTIIFPDSGCC